ncbi:Serine/threonine protein kinase [Globisporangium polare]
MKQMCGAAFEFEVVCCHVIERLEEICAHLQQCKNREDVVVSFASILFRFCKLLLEIGKRGGHPLFRFIASRAMTNRIQDSHEELDYFAPTLGSFDSVTPWKDRDAQERLALQDRLEEQLSTDEALVDACDSDAEKATAAARLDYELRAGGDDTSRAGVQGIRNRFLRVYGVVAPAAPDWFVSRDDVEFNSWNFVKTECSIEYYEGKWRKTGVMVETHPHITHEFKRAAAQWHQLSHPNVAKMYGACDIGTPMFFVYELVHDGVELHEFLKSDANRDSLWQCLLSAALGLQYPHSRDVVHGDLRGDNIIVGANSVVKLCSVRENWNVFHTSDRNVLNWMTPELLKGDVGGKSNSSLASDIYAFGMCIREALTRGLPWKDTFMGDIYERVSTGQLPARPESIGDPQWDLISKMCAFNPSERVTITYVVNRLKQFVLDSEQRRASGVVRASLSPSDDTEQLLDLDGHVFAKLDDVTTATALEEIVEQCQELQDSGQWMLNRVCPALAFIVDLLRERKKKPEDVEGVAFCAALSRLQRYLRTAHSKRSVYQLARSRQVAETHHLVYSDLDRMLSMLEVSAIRVWSKSDRIGKGSFGTVYKGSWLSTPVVIKFLGYEEDFDTISPDLLLHEVRVWHRLNHPHVLKMYGHTGLQYLHAQNVVHNDLKCDNIMVGSAKLIDFGLSGLLGEAEAQVEVRKMGAVNWRSPEYLTGGRPSKESDVYSFAMCIVEVASGAIPWGHATIPAQVRFQLKKENVPHLPDSATEKQRGMVRAMAKREPAERMRLAFVVDKLHEIAQDESAVRAPRSLLLAADV